MYEGVTQQLAKAVAGIKYQDLPAGAEHKIKMMLLDSIGCALGAYATPKARIILDMIDEVGGNPQASIIGYKRTSCPKAAHANAELINTLDYDYLGPPGGHVGPFVTPSCLAVAERQHSSGKDFILAMAIAHEVGGRMSDSLVKHRYLAGNPPVVHESPRFTYANTMFGGIAGAGKLLGLDAAGLANAFGIGGVSSSVPGAMKWEMTGGPAIMTKYGCASGWIAEIATMAPIMASKGFTGDNTILDGEFGFWQMVGSPFFKEKTLVDGLGKKWHIDKIHFKAFPCCGLNHTGIDCIRRIMGKNNLKPEDIEEIVVKVDPMIQTPNRVGREINSFLDAQFFYTYSFAIAPFYGRTPGPAWQTPEVYNSPEIRAMFKKVRVETHPRAQEIIDARVKAGKHPTFHEGIVDIKAKGKTFTMVLDEPKGEPTNPMTQEEFLRKFRDNASFSKLRGKKAEAIIEKVDELDKLSDFSDLMAVVRVGRALLP